jgi:hypothetical protein
MSDSVVTETPATDTLTDVIANRRWLHRAHPFPHIVATEVFAAAFYRELADQIGGIVANGLSETPDGRRFSRGMPGYDAYGISITEQLDGPLTTFISPAWRDLMCGLLAVERTPYVFAGAHYHAPGSADGFIHNDFNPLWFPRSSNDIQVPDSARCNFRTGEGPLEPDEKVETIRGAVVIFYLLNDGWRPGDGGETGLFLSRTGNTAAPDVRCAPVNNSLVAFECTPQSFHAFLRNTRIPRTSIIMWVHRGLEEAVERHGEDTIERWQS